MAADVSKINTGQVAVCNLGSISVSCQGVVTRLEMGVVGCPATAAFQKASRSTTTFIIVALFI